MRTIDIWISECPECKRVFVGNTMRQAESTCRMHVETKHTTNKRPKTRRVTLMLIE